MNAKTDLTSLRRGTPAWYDSMYNNRALVPDFADHFARWQSASEATRSQLQCTLDVAYGTGLNETEMPSASIRERATPEPQIHCSRRLLCSLSRPA